MIRRVSRTAVFCVILNSAIYIHFIHTVSLWLAFGRHPAYVLLVAARTVGYENMLPPDVAVLMI
jgi:hypothetical protein